MRTHSAQSDWRQPPLVITSAGNAASALPVRDKTPHQLSAGVSTARTGPDRSRAELSSFFRPLHHHAQAKKNHHGRAGLSVWDG